MILRVSARVGSTGETFRTMSGADHRDTLMSMANLTI